MASDTFQIADALSVFLGTVVQKDQKSKLILLAFYIKTILSNPFNLMEANDSDTLKLFDLLAQLKETVDEMIVSKETE